MYIKSSTKTIYKEEMASNNNLYQRTFFYKLYCDEIKECSIHWSNNEDGDVRKAKNSTINRRKLPEGLAEIITSPTFKFKLIEYYPCDTYTKVLLRLDYHVLNNNCINKPLDKKEKQIMEKYSNKDRASYYAHRQRILNNPVLICECGAKVKRYYMTSHKKTEKHKMLLSSRPKE